MAFSQEQPPQPTLDATSTPDIRDGSTIDSIPPPFTAFEESTTSQPDQADDSNKTPDQEKPKAARSKLASGSMRPESLFKLKFVATTSPPEALVAHRNRQTPPKPHPPLLACRQLVPSSPQYSSPLNAEHIQTPELSEDEQFGDGSGEVDESEGEETNKDGLCVTLRFPTPD